MPYALHSFKIDHDGQIRVRHTFYGETKQEAEQVQEKHADVCPSYGPAVDKEETIDFMEKIDAVPDAEELAAVDEIEGDGGAW